MFRTGKGRLDPFVAIVAAAQKMREAMREFAAVPGQPQRPRETPLGAFFRTSYRVGAESLTRDIPTQVLLEVLATALLVTRTCVLGVFGERAGAIRRNPIYRFGLDLPLRAFHALVLGLRAPGLLLAVLAAVFLIALTLLVVGVVFSGALVFTPQAFSLNRALLFYAAPALAIVIVLLIAAWMGKRLAAP